MIIVKMMVVGGRINGAVGKSQMWNTDCSCFLQKLFTDCQVVFYLFYIWCLTFTRGAVANLNFLWEARLSCSHLCINLHFVFLLNFMKIALSLLYTFQWYSLHCWKFSTWKYIIGCGCSPTLQVRTFGTGLGANKFGIDLFWIWRGFRFHLVFPPRTMNNGVLLIFIWHKHMIVDWITCESVFGENVTDSVLEIWAANTITYQSMSPASKQCTL